MQTVMLRLVVQTCEEELARGVGSKGGGANLAHRHSHPCGTGRLWLGLPGPPEGAAWGHGGVLRPPHCLQHVTQDR